ncbi:hypothetical protein QL285_032613 [Trifolium repens]|nr:hypothetical protein QL285_032613 [Trifolium repens]
MLAAQEREREEEINFQEMKVAQSLDEMPINFGNSLLDKRGHFHKANCYSHSRILQRQKRKVQNFKGYLKVRTEGCSWMQPVTEI